MASILITPIMGTKKKGNQNACWNNGISYRNLKWIRVCTQPLNCLVKLAFVDKACHDSKTFVFTAWMLSVLKFVLKNSSMYLCKTCNTI